MLQIMYICEGALKLPKNLIFLEKLQPGMLLPVYPGEVKLHE